MAKSTSFFGKRKKSTKSLTFSTWRGLQITKDRVTNVSNPQTSSQMSQRIKFALVSNTRARLNGLVNHSFQGVNYGYKSIYKFMSENLSGKLSISDVRPKGDKNVGIADLLVSDGTLEPIVFGIRTTSNDGDDNWNGYTANPDSSNFADVWGNPIFKCPGNRDYEIDFKFEGSSVPDETWSEFIDNVFLGNDDELSFLNYVARQTYQPLTDENYELPIYGISLYRLTKGMNLIGPTDPQNQVYLYTNIDEDNLTPPSSATALRLGKDAQIVFFVEITEKGDDIYTMKLAKDHFTNDMVPSSEFYDDATYKQTFPNCVSKTQMAKGDCAIYSGRVNPYSLTSKEMGLLGATAIIRSKKNEKGTWQRSTQKLTNTAEKVPDIILQSITDTYLKSGSTSAKFLNNGSDSTGIDGNSGTDTTTSQSDNSDSSISDEKSQG